MIREWSTVDAQLMGSTTLVQANAFVRLITQILEFVTFYVTLLS